MTSEDIAEPRAVGTPIETCAATVRTRAINTEPEVVVLGPRAAIREAVIVIVVLAIAGPASGQVTVVREGNENPAVSVAKSTFWGGMTGLLLGGAAALVANDHRDDIVKWCFVGGTFGGFLFGVYHAATREAPSTGLIDVEDRRLRLALPAVGPAPSEQLGGPPIPATRTVRLVLFSASL